MIMTAGTATKTREQPRYLRSCATSSARWRSERPPIVFDGEILHWLRIRFVFTRPYLGTAISMSMTLAVWTYSGGSMSNVWILTLLPFRSRFSWARFDRMSLALRRASIRWSSDLSGAALEDWTGACTGRQYIRGQRERKPLSGVCEKNSRLTGDPCQLRAQLLGDPRAGRRIAEGLCANGNDPCTCGDHIGGVAAARDAAHRHDRDRDRGRHCPDLGQRH